MSMPWLVQAISTDERTVQAAECAKEAAGRERPLLRLRVCAFRLLLAFVCVCLVWSCRVSAGGQAPCCTYWAV